MCGIFTVINKNSKPINIEKCRNSLDLMKKRGPDWKVDKLINNNIYMIISYKGMRNGACGRGIKWIKIELIGFIISSGEIKNA